MARDEYPLYSLYRGESHASGLVKSVLEGSPTGSAGLLIHGASILTSWPQTPVWRRVLSELEFVVCIDRQLTADAAYADLVLPATTMFEIDSYMVYGPIFRLREKLIEPVGEARNDYLIMAELARRLGYGDRFPQSEEALIRFALEGSGYTLEQVRAAGRQRQAAFAIMEYEKWKKGRLRPDGQPGFDTPTGKFEIASTRLEDYGYEPLPKYTEPSEGPLGNPVLAQSFPWSSTRALAPTRTSAPSTTASGASSRITRSPRSTSTSTMPRPRGIAERRSGGGAHAQGCRPLPGACHEPTSFAAPWSAAWAGAARWARRRGRSGTSTS